MTVHVTIGGVKLGMMKRNPWRLIDPAMAKKDYTMYFRLPPWADNPAARPAGVKAINDIFAYVRRAYKDAHVASACKALGAVMSLDEGFGSVRTKADLDARISQYRGLLKPRKHPVEEIRAIAEGRRTRVPTFQSIAVAMRA